MTNDRDSAGELEDVHPTGKAYPRNEEPAGNRAAAPEDELFRDPFAQEGSSAR